MNSKWVPWETGVADQAKNNESIAVIPVNDSGGRFEGSEYLQLYRRIIIPDQGGLAIFKPSENKGPMLDYFIRHLSNI